MGKHQPCLLPPPLLLTSHEDQSGKLSFYNLLENQYHTTCILVLRNKSVLCSAYGWFVLIDQTKGSDSEGECCIWNPTSSEIIQLPVVVDHPRAYVRCFLSKPPCGNELLLVTKMAFNLFTRIHFRIFRVDVGVMKCEELDNLDGRTIFISFYGNGFCRSSESFGAAVKPNSIYYTNESGMVIYVFDLEDRSITTLLPYPDADIDPYSSINYWVDLPYIPMKNS